MLSDTCSQPILRPLYDLADPGRPGDRILGTSGELLRIRVAPKERHPHDPLCPSIPKLAAVAHRAPMSPRQTDLQMFLAQRNARSTRSPQREYEPPLRVVPR